MKIFVFSHALQGRGLIIAADLVLYGFVGRREWGRSDQSYCCICCVSSRLSTPSWGCKSLEVPSAHRRQWMGGVLRLALSWAGKNKISCFFKFSMIAVVLFQTQMALSEMFLKHSLYF